ARALRAPVRARCAHHERAQFCARRARYRTDRRAHARAVRSEKTCRVIPLLRSVRCSRAVRLLVSGFGLALCAFGRPNSNRVPKKLPGAAISARDPRCAQKPVRARAKTRAQNPCARKKSARRTSARAQNPPCARNKAGAER
ncbi:MAG TPA: hypothetical protein VHC22_14205, partial [Pirellulales bacterium]|nr:hypothetical protein [Pirellulales bacterium]